MEGMRQLETAEEETRQGRNTKKPRIAIVISRKGAKDCLLGDFCHQESFVSEHQALLLLLGRATLSAGGALVPSCPPELPTIRKAEKLQPHVVAIPVVSMRCLASFLAGLGWVLKIGRAERPK